MKRKAETDVAETTGNLRGTRARVVAAIRVLGVVAVFVVARRATDPLAIPPHEAMFASLGIGIVVGALWLCATGSFGYGSPHRSDWVAVVPFLIALAVRELFTLHSVEEIELAFATGPTVKHSVVYALVQLFYAPLVDDAHAFTMHLNGGLGAFATLPLYLFVRQRVGNRAAGVSCALFFAVHPIVARFAPTDAPYSLMLATWFSGLALLSAHPVQPRGLLGGAVLLGVAATTRIEGLVIVAASMLLLDLRPIWTRARADPLLTAFGALVAASLVAVQMFAQLHHFWGMPGSRDPISSILTEAVRLGSYSSVSFERLVWFGAAIGILPRFRLGLRAFLATVIVVAPVAPSSDWIPALHRLVPTCAVQTIVAGMGAYGLAAWLPSASRRLWLATAPGVGLALWMLLQTRGALSEPYPFTAAYDIIRAHLAPRGVPSADCTLMAFNPSVDSLDLHDIGQVVPPIRALDCSRVDCVAELHSDDCLFYFRTTTAYRHAGRVPTACTAAAATGLADPGACLSPAAARLESAMEMTPVETRVVRLADRIPASSLDYPAEVAIGLFRVRSR